MTVPTPDLCEVTITAPDAQWLHAFTRELVTDHLCAVAHQVAAIETTYIWRDELHEETEAKATLRTRHALVPLIVERLQAQHPYEVPGLTVTPILAATDSYAAWIRTNTLDQGTDTPEI